MVSFTPLSNTVALFAVASQGDVDSESYYLTLFQHMSSGKSILDLNIKRIKLVTWENLDFLWGNIEANTKLKRSSNDVEGKA